MTKKEKKAAKKAKKAKKCKTIVNADGTPACDNTQVLNIINSSSLKKNSIGQKSASLGSNCGCEEEVTIPVTVKGVQNIRKSCTAKPDPVPVKTSCEKKESCCGNTEVTKHTFKFNNGQLVKNE